MALASVTWRYSRRKRCSTKRMPRSYSTELAETVVNEIKVELLCPDEAVAFLVKLLKHVAHTGDHEEGWVVVTDTLAVEAIGNGREEKP